MDLHSCLEQENTEFRERLLWGKGQLHELGGMIGSLGNPENMAKVHHSSINKIKEINYIRKNKKLMSEIMVLIWNKNVLLLF